MVAAVDGKILVGILCRAFGRVGLAKLVSWSCNFDLADSFRVEEDVSIVVLLKEHWGGVGSASKVAMVIMTSFGIPMGSAHRLGTRELIFVAGWWSTRIILALQCQILLNLTVWSPMPDTTTNTNPSPTQMMVTTMTMATMSHYLPALTLPTTHPNSTTPLHHPTNPLPIAKPPLTTLTDPPD